jgi:hypothetical protein
LFHARIRSTFHPEALVGFLAAPDHEQMLRDIRDAFLQLPPAEAGWMARLYSLVSAGYGDAGLRVLREWIDGSGAPGVLAACELLRAVQPEFLLEWPDFIQILLSRADAASLDVLDTVRTTLYDVVRRVAAEGAKAGMVGSPWPPFVEIQEKGQTFSVDRALSSSRLAREFDRELTRLAEERIQDARDSGEERVL